MSPGEIKQVLVLQKWSNDSRNYTSGYPLPRPIRLNNFSLMFNLIGVIWHGLFGPRLFLLDWSLGVCSVGDLAWPQNGP